MIIKRNYRTLSRDTRPENPFSAWRSRRSRSIVRQNQQSRAGGRGESPNRSTLPRVTERNRRIVETSSLDWMALLINMHALSARNCAKIDLSGRMLPERSVLSLRFTAPRDVRTPILSFAFHLFSFFFFFHFYSRPSLRRYNDTRSDVWRSSSRLGKDPFAGIFIATIPFIIRARDTCSFSSPSLRPLF